MRVLIQSFPLVAVYSWAGHSQFSVQNSSTNMHRIPTVEGIMPGVQVTKMNKT